VQRLSLMVEWASASKTPKRSVSISSSRVPRLRPASFERP
jgi:hypothetical protein